GPGTIVTEGGHACHNESGTLLHERVRTQAQVVQLTPGRGLQQHVGRGDKGAELVTVCRLAQIKHDRTLAAVVLPEEQRALGISPVFVEGTDAARGTAAGWLYFDNISTQTCQRQPTILRLLVGQFDDAETGERTRAGRAVAADRTLVLCFHGDPPI